MLAVLVENKNILYTVKLGYNIMKGTEYCAIINKCHYNQVV
jgi:hypothetical protein